MCISENNIEYIKSERSSSSQVSIAFSIGYALSAVLIVVIIAGNIIVLVTVACDRKLRILTTNKFIVSLAISDLLIGVVVMPLSLYAKLRSDTWVLGEQWCTFHLMSAIFSTTASIVHLVAISLDRYFAIMFPTEYQRHSISTSALPYVIMIWTLSLAVSSTLFLSKPLESHGICWVEDPQYLVLSSFLSFFLPGAIVVYLYVKIFQKLRKHKLFMFGTTGLLGKRKVGTKGDKNRTLPEVIIEEVKSRRGSRLSQVSESRKNSSPETPVKPERSPSQPEMRPLPLIQQRWRSPTICAETLEHNRKIASSKRVSIVSDPPSMEINFSGSRVTLSDFNTSTNETNIRESDGDNVDGVSSIMSNSMLINSIPMDDSMRRQSSCLLEVPSANQPFIHTNNSQQLQQVSSRREKYDLASQSDEKNFLGKKTRKKKTDFFKFARLYTQRVHVNNHTVIKNLEPENTLISIASSMLHRAEPSDSGSRDARLTSLKVPKLWRSSSAALMSLRSSFNSSVASTFQGDRFHRRISMNSFNSSLTESDSAGDLDSRRSSTWSAARATLLGGQLGCAIQGVLPGLGTKSAHFFIKKSSITSQGKLKRIATQVTKAVRQKRRESMAMRRESRATRVVAAILIAFLICWIPYFCISVYRGICTGLQIPFDKRLHAQLFLATSWLGYTHSCFNPIIYTSLNKSFRRRLRELLCFKSKDLMCL